MQNQHVRSASPIPFPQSMPHGYDYISEPVKYDPHKHLALQRPDDVLRLQDLGYTKEEIAQCPTDFAVSSATRLLSDEGVDALVCVVRELRQYAVGCERIQNMVRGGVYQSRFLRDLCLCPKVTQFLSEIYGTPVTPHSMPLHLGHLNFAPDDLALAVDKWHHDTLGLDYVLMVSDPATLRGGEFQYFLGTKHEAAALAQRGEQIPAQRVVSPQFPGLGYMVVLQGNMVVHRGAKLTAKCERITMVNGYVPLDTRTPDPCRFSDLKLVDPHHVLFSEWARHKAWLAQSKLERLTVEMPFTDDPAELVRALKEAVADVEVAIADLSDESAGSMLHYGD